MSKFSAEGVLWSAKPLAAHWRVAVQARIAFYALRQQVREQQSEV
jgi:hypothetical protein